MSKNKNMYGVICKSIHRSRHRRDGGGYPSTKFPIRLGVVNFLFFQIFICLAALMITPNVWAALTSMSVDASGDTIFRGGSDRLLITFTVDDRTDEDGDPYTVSVDGGALIAQGTVSPSETVRILWDGSANGQQLPDGTYDITVELNRAKGEDEEEGDRKKTVSGIILDATPPRITSIVATDLEEDDIPITEGSFVNTSISSIKVTQEAGGSRIDRSPNLTNVTLKDERGVEVGGSLSYADNVLTFTLGNPLDAPSESGTYTLEITLSDEAHNTLRSQTKFTFDDVVTPSLTSVATSRGRLTPGAGVNQRVNYVEATLAGSLDLSASSIRLTGPDGPVSGQQTQPSTNRIRWQLSSPLLPTGGLQDGEYTIEIRLVDKVGNKIDGDKTDNEDDSPFKVSFTYDNLAPKISLSPPEGAPPFKFVGDTVYYNHPITEFVATFGDGDGGIGVSLPSGQQGDRIVFGTPTDDGINVLSGRSFVDADSNNTLTHVLDKPIVSRDGSQDGHYILNIRATDTLGNTKIYNYRLIYDTQLPTLVSTTPAANETVSELSQVEVKLNEKTSGIDFIERTEPPVELTRFDATVVENDGYVPVNVNITSNGRDTITLTLTEPIALDGSDDGTYRIKVTPTDRAGNSGITAVREFYLISQKHEPEIRLTIPETTTVNSLATLTAEITDYIGAGIDFDASTLTVRNSQGVLIPQEDLEHDDVNNLLIWTAEAPVARDGSADGEYTVTATFVDFTGQSFTQEFPILLDTQFPAIKSVQIAAESPTQLAEDRTTDIADSVDQIVVAFDEAAGDIDFGVTLISLAGPDGTDIPINRVDDGQAVLTLNFQTLTQRGEYTLSITPQDLAGNQSTAPFVYRFRIDVALPAVSSVLIDGKVGTLVYVNGAAANIVATFVDLSGVGVALGDGGSTITVANANGIPAPGITTSNGTNQLTWTPIVLPTDGSADGRYTVTITPIDNAGRQGDVVYRQFVYDTQEPRITAATPLMLNQPVTYIGGTFTQLQFTVEDVIPGENIEPAGLELEEQTIDLLDPEGVSVDATVTSDEINSLLYLTLSNPFARDGSADGTYTVRVSLVDKAGNSLDSVQTFIYDSQVPRLSSVMINTESPVELVPQQVTEISETTSTITLQFEEATRVDFANTVVTLAGPGEQPITLNLSTDGLSQLTARFVELTQAGLYTLSVTPQDIAGNVAQGAVQYTFRLELVLPSVSSVKLGGQTGDVVFLNGSDSTIVATLVDATGTGLALGEGGSSIVVTNASEAVVPGQIRTEGNDQLIWEPVSLPTDGSVDGRYTVTITPVDKAGRSGDVVSRQFIYDTERPRITVSSPLMLSQPVSYVSGNLSQFAFTVEDVGPADLVLEEQTIILVDAAGDPVSSTVTHDELTNQLYLTLSSPFAQDGSADGEYTVRLGIVDKAGNLLDSEHTFIYDSQVPRLSFVTVNTESPVVLIPEGIADISESINSITLQFEESTRVDFTNTVITLIGPDGESIPLTLEDNGTTGLTASFLPLRQVGMYTLSVTAQDVAGNVAPGAVDYQFALDLVLPRVSSVMIGGKSGDVVFINGSDPTIVATFSDDTGTSLTGGGSSVVVKNGDVVVPGRTRTEGANQLIWEPLSLPTDGSVDGRYTVEITPVDTSGRRGDIVSRQFVYDTEEPQITASSPLMLSQPVSYLSGGLNQFTFTVADVVPAAGIEPSDILWESQTIELLDASETTVPAALTYDELASQLYLTLSSPFAQDGSADGGYTVKLGIVDKAGNLLDVEHTFIYDSQVPRLSSVTLNTESPVVLIPEGIADISESISSIAFQFEESTRVDFVNTQVTLMGPDGEAVPLTLEDNGTTGLTASFLPLRQVGIYTLSVTAQDVAGNVAPGAVNYQFALDLALPRVSSVMIGGKSGDVVFVNGSETTIIATFSDDTGARLTEGGSGIVVTNASGTVVLGRTHAEGANQLIWQPLSLPTDGSVDGRYTVTITPVDQSGRRGDVVSRQFIYDTEEPQITASSPLMLSQPVSYLSGGLNQFTFTVADVVPAAGIEPSDILWESQTIELLDASGNAVPATVTSDELASQLYLTLSSPFAQDGSADGEYIVKLGIVDKAGNLLDVEHTFIYDSQVSHLSSVMVNTDPPVELVPNRIAEILESISSITLKFEEATRIDFANTQITLMGPDPSGETDDTGVPIEVAFPVTLQDDGASQVTVSFLKLEHIGSYTLSVTPRDVAGNAASGPVNYRFFLDIPLPRVSSVVIGESETAGSGDVAYVNASNMIIGAILLDPTGTGLSFGTEGSSITVVDSDNTIVRGATGSNGENLIVWEPIGLTSDGTTDGRYSVYVIPVDQAGRQGSTVYREFIYDTQEPEIIDADPINLSQPVSYISRSLTQLSFTVADVGPADLMLSDQKVSLRDASGSLVPAQLTDDTENQLFLTLDQPLPLDGSMDGEYTVSIELADQAGNPYTVEHLIVYDTQAPTLVSTVPTDGALLTEDITQIQVTLNDKGGSGIDWAITTVTLVDPNGTQISGELISDGTAALTLTTNQLVADGRYIIRVQAVDRAGNGDATVFERSFLLSRRLPTVISTDPITAPADEAFTNEELERIEVRLETDDENHLSTLRLINDTEQVIAGQQRRTSNRLIYDLIRPLATDGSEDGIYTIEFTPISASGRSGGVQRFTFTYDTQSPEIETDEVINLVVVQPEVNNSLTEIRVNLTDETSGIDWKNLDEKWLTFERLSPNPTKISGRVSDDGQGNLTFRLTVPLADNGSADGEYQITINPKDRAGNDDEPYERVFVYDTNPPTIDEGTLLINEIPLLVDINAEDYPTAVSTTGGVVIQANIFDTGLGVNLAQSRITVRSPDGSEISGNTQQNGVDTLIFKSDGLTLQGVYKITVISIGNDSELLGFAPTDSITTEFLYETTAPTAAITSDGGETELTDKALPLEGTASDPEGTQRVGEGEIPVPASGVWLVEIVGTGPDKQPIDPVAAVDDSDAEQELWSVWSIDFLPTRSGEYDLDVRVTDNAGNYAIYDIGKYTMSVSLTFRGTTFGWPNPLRHSKRDVAFFSFDVNVPLGDTIELTLSIYDWSGDMVLSQTYPDVVSGQRNDQLVKWNLENQAGTAVARGLYIFRLEAVNAAGNRANVVGKVLVVD